MFVVFDLDGTLSDQAHRLPLVKGEVKDYEAFYNACHLDPPRLPIIALMKRLIESGARVEIWTGRTDRVREQTVKWLADHGIDEKHLTCMRKEGDFTPDFKLKAQWLANGSAPDLVFEDRPRMVEFWRGQGITCCDVGGDE